MVKNRVISMVVSLVMVFTLCIGLSDFKFDLTDHSSERIIVQPTGIGDEPW